MPRETSASALAIESPVMVGHRARHPRHRGLLLHARDDQVARPLGNAEVDVGEQWSGPGKARRSDPHDILVRHERPFQDSIVTASCPHPKRVPGLLDVISWCVAWHEGMYALGSVWVSSIYPVDAEAGTGQQ